MKKIIFVLIIILVAISSFMVGYFVNSTITDEKGYAVGKIIAVNEQGNKFAITVEDAQGYYKKEIGNQASFGIIEEITDVNTDLNMERKVIVTYQNVNGRILAIKIDEF